jgi:hypothetical protein
MHSFLSRFASLVTGVLCGLDRLSLCASLRMISFPLGLQNYLWAQRVLFKDFGEHSEKVTAQLEEASLKLARQQGREIRYLNSSEHNKENIAREIAERDHIKNGLICVLSSVDPCMSFEIRKNRATHKLEIRYRQRKCLHLYHYQIHPVFGFRHARIQTWFPFRVYVCINGREWLARQMDQAGLHYIKRNNTFTWLEDVAAAQALFDQQLQANWSSLLGGLTEALNPVHQDIFAKFPCNYYWSIRDSEWASDVMFRSREALQSIYPRLIRYAINSFSAVDVLRFLGQPVSASGKVPHRRRFEVSTNLKERLEGVRIKHWLNGNSIKAYDKYSVLRPETMIREPGDFKVLRPAEGEPDDSPPDWRPLRKGLADLRRRAEISQAANERYLEALAAVHDSTPMRELLEPLCRPTADLAPPLPTPRLAQTAAEAAPATPVPALDAAATEPPIPAARPRRARALNPLAPDDAALLAAVGRHEFMINGLRNRDLRRLLFSTDTVPDNEQRKRSAAVTRKLRLLRAHGLIDKVAKSHRYQVTEQGRKAITAFLAARSASTEQLTSSAA